MHSLSQEVLVWFLGIVGTVITSILIPFITSWLKAKSNNEKVKYVIDELSNTTQISVDYIQQTMVNQLKADGKFDEESQKTALKLATNICLENLSANVKKILSKDGIDLESIVKKYIESAVLNNKKTTCK